MAYQQKGKTFDEFAIGDVFQTSNRTITETDVVNFAGLSGDFNPLHTDQTFAENTPYKERVAHGLLGVAIGSGLANQLGIFEGTTIALLSMEVQYQGAILFGDTIHLEIKVIDKKESTRPDRGIVTFATDLINQKGETVTTGKWMVLMSRMKGYW